MTDENPYQSPASADESLLSATELREQARAAVGPPARLIVIFCTGSLLLQLLIIGYVAYIVFKAPQNVSGLPIAFAPHLTLIAVHAFTIYGAICMLRLRSLRVARTAMVLACIPFLSPLFVIGIPFGIWGAIVLWKPHIRAEFENLELNKPLFK